MALRGEDHLSEKRRLGTRVAKLRMSKGLSQSKLAMMADINRPTLNQIESAQANPRLETLARIAHGLGVEIEDLFKD